MSYTETDAANSALIKIGEKKLTDIDTDTGTVAEKCREQFGKLRKEVLRAHPWNCASRRAKLQQLTATITNATTEDPVKITASNEFEDGDHITIEDAEGMAELNDESYLVANVTSADFKLQDEDGEDVNGTSYTPYTSGGTARRTPAFQFDYMYQKPTNCLRIISQVDPDDDSVEYDHVVEGDFILTDEDECYIKYIIDLTDPDKWDAMLREAFAFRLAAELAYPQAGSKTLAAEMDKKYQDMLAAAWSVDGQEGVMEVVDMDDWIDARG